MIRQYKIGQSYMYGNMVVVSSTLTDVTEKQFYKLIKQSLKRFKLENCSKNAHLISNLKKGVTIGSDFYKIIDKKK